MRKDMAKIIVERPRIWAGPLRNRPKRINDTLPKFSSARRDAAERGGEKEFSENLKPLWRYLDRQVGRPWDKVYSEICANLRPDSTIQKHVLDHLKRDVAIGSPSAPGWRWPLFYVEQRTGLLRRVERLTVRQRRRLYPTSPVERIPLEPLLELRKLDGLWFAIRLARLPEPEYRAISRTVKVKKRPWLDQSTVLEREVMVRQLVTPAVVDIVTGQAVRAGPELDDECSWRAFRRDHPERTYAVSKRQISGAELRRYGLKNDPEPS